MSASDSDERGADGDAQQRADQTLTGVAPPKVETTADEPRHSPVQVRAGTAPDEVPAPPKAALPSRPPPPSQPQAQRRPSTAPPPPPPQRRSQRPSATPPPPPVRAKPAGVFTVPPAAPEPVAPPPAAAPPVAAPAPVAAPPPVAAAPVAAPAPIATPAVAPPPLALTAAVAPAPVHPAREAAPPPIATATVAPIVAPPAVAAPHADPAIAPPLSASPHVSAVTEAVLHSQPSPSLPGAFVSATAPSLALGVPEEPRWLVIARAHPVLWMVGAPLLVALLLVTVLYAIGPEPREEPPASPAAAHVAPEGRRSIPGDAAAPAAAAAPARVGAEELAALEAKPVEKLSAAELLRLHEARATRDRDATKTLAHKLEAEPALAQEAGLRAELLRAATDGDTARDALAAMVQAEAPIGADLLYEVWVGKATPADVAELAGQLLQSAEVKAKTSPALAATLGLRHAPTCEAALDSLARVKQDGDRRSLTALARLNARKGCGPKKNQDCYACLRSQPKELAAAVNAVKGRKAPSYP